MQTQRFERNRFLYLILSAGVIGLGLVWRSPLLAFSPFISKYGGDSLWAVLVFIGFGFLFPRLPTQRIAIISLCFAWSIEFSQMYHAPWIDSIRAHRLGGLILGSTFNSPDLLAYAIGILSGSSAESLCTRWNRK